MKKRPATVGRVAMTDGERTASRVLVAFVETWTTGRPWSTVAFTRHTLVDLSEARRNGIPDQR